jgi:hypothetical protein
MGHIYTLSAVCDKPFYEKCESNIFDHNFDLDHFLKKLSKVENLCTKPLNGIYVCGGLSWPMDLENIILHEKTYPSSYFLTCIEYLIIIDSLGNESYIANPPILLCESDAKIFDYVICTNNKLAILNSLFEEGSHETYESIDGNQFSPKIYSEHSGVITLVDKNIDNIIVSTKSQIVGTDSGIYLPKNTIEMSKHKYLFHTHPNASTYGGRIKSDGVIYELPSINDILNFLKFSRGTEGKALASIVITPEGTYVIRKIKLDLKTKKISQNMINLYQKAIIQIEHDAILKLKQNLEKLNLKLSDLKTASNFHKFVSRDLDAINSYNKFVSDLNIFVEYYPRVEVEGKWRLHTLHLPLV